MGQLEDMQMFIRIIEAGGIGKASEQLNLAKSAVSRRLSELEKRLGTQLLRRTTRKSSLTDAGTTYYQLALNIVDDVSAMNAHISGVETSLEGTLKMAVPLSFGLMHLSSVIDEFTKLHPKLTIQIDFADRHIDMVEEGYELAIRIADLEDSSLRAKRITPIRHIFCASPAYINEKGEPEDLTDLAGHSFLQYGITSPGSVQITDSRGMRHSIQMNTRVKANNGDFLKEMAINGHGIVYLPTFLTCQAIANQDLVPVLTQYQLPVMHAYAVYPQTRFLSQRCRLMIDFIAERFGDEPYWDQQN